MSRPASQLPEVRPASLATALALAFVIALGSGACGGEPDPSPAGQAEPEMTRRQTDSALAGSGLPNAEAVGEALRAADTLQATQRRADSALERMK